MKEAFPEATIVRPAKLFGNNDRFLTWIALMATRTGRVPLVRERLFIVTFVVLRYTHVAENSVYYASHNRQHGSWFLDSDHPRTGAGGFMPFDNREEKAGNVKCQRR